MQHNQNKDFWNRALVVISLTNSLTQTHALFLEWFSIAAATQARRYSLENGNAGARPHTPAPLEADCHEIFETAATLVATVFTRDHLFASPIMATIAVMGRSANDWLEWKTPQGQTLDAVKRQVVGVAA